MRVIWLLLILVGCASQYHVTLPAPSPTITPDARVAMFWKMRPANEGVVTINGNIENDTIMLGDKTTEVVSPEDLEPLVPAGSETMRYARESVRARKKSHFLFNVSAPLVVGGACVFTFGDGTVGLVGAAVALVGLIPYVMHRHYNTSELQLRRQAFHAYPADLGSRLNVCAHGNQVIPCEAPLPEEKPIPATNVPSRTGSLRMRDADLLGVR